MLVVRLETLMTGANSGMAGLQGWIKILRDLGAFSSGRLFYMPCKLFILRQFVPDLWRPLARLSSTVASEAWGAALQNLVWNRLYRWRHLHSKQQQYSPHIP